MSETNENTKLQSKEIETTQTKTAPNKERRETFSLEYVQELREENKSLHRSKLDVEKSIKEKEELFSKKQQEFESTMSAKEQAANERIIRAELKAHAISHGIVDLDALKLVDATEIKVSSDGEVIGAEEVIKSLKEKKSYLFKENKSSTYTGKDAEPEKGSKKTSSSNVFNMSNEEFKKAKSQRIWRVK